MLKVKREGWGMELDNSKFGMKIASSFPFQD